MKAVVQDAFGGPEVLKAGEKPLPVCNENEVLIKVEYSALNRADLMQRTGNYPPPPGATDVLGLECSGYLDSRKVMALLPGGGYAQFAKVHKDHVLEVPEFVSLEQAAAITEVWATAYQILHLVGEAKQGESILVHAGCSGVGLALTQLAKAHNMTVISTSSCAEKLQVCAKHGADHTINYKTEDFAARVKDLTNGKGVDLVADPVGASHCEKNLAALGLDSRWVLYGLMGGPEVSAFSLRTMLMKRIQLRPTTLKTRSDTYKKSLLEAMSKVVFPGIESGKFTVLVDKVYGMSEAGEAHVFMGMNANIGKVLLKNDF